MVFSLIVCPNITQKNCSGYDEKLISGDYSDRFSE